MKNLKPQKLNAANKMEVNMKEFFKKFFANKKLVAIVLAAVLVVAACGTTLGIVLSKKHGGESSGSEFVVPDANLKKGTYRTFTSVMPSNWNELTYQDNNDVQIMNYIKSSFFEYDYAFEGGLEGKYNSDGTINKDAIIDGGYTTNYSAATKLEDVTSTVDAKWGYTDKQKQEGGYAWKITLRKDLKWDDGTAIHAEDFIYSMKEQLNPYFLNYRANTFYDTLRIKKSKAYFNKNQTETYPTVASKGYESIAAAAAAGEPLYIDVYNFYGAKGYVDANGNEAPQWVSITDTTVYDSVDGWADTEKSDKFSGKSLFEGYGAYLEVGAQYESCLGIKVENNERDVTWEDVGMYAVDADSFVVLLDKSYQLLKEDGSLSYLAAYYMESLPLVKKSLYESCKVAPVEGSTLWTSKYNSSLGTTASWGPYKLTAFQSGKAYTLTRNDNWYGYSMVENKNQYNVTAIECEKIEEPSQQWLKFLSGEVDGVSLDSDHIADYMHSKYVVYTPGTGTFGMQLYGKLSVLKESENNNGILAIDEFRQAVSLSLNRSDVVETIWPGTSVACFGLMNSQYYYDVENGGVYRNTKEAKEGLLRAYGFTESDGKWSSGAIQNATLDDAYEALTGYNPVLAKELVKQAYAKLVANAADYGYDNTKKITLVYGSSVDNAKQRERAQYVQKLLDTLCEGTELAGKIEVKFDASAGSKWSEAFRTGKTQIGFGYGFSGNPFNPFNIVGSFVDPDDSLNYHQYWDTKSVMMTLTLPAGDYDAAGETVTMSLCNWYYCLNGLATEKNAPKKYNWDAGFAPAEVRLKILAALEEQVIKKSYSIMLIGEYSGELQSPKFSQISYDYNTFMSYGGMRYLEVNYTDAEWTAYVKAHNNDLTAEYKKAE